MHATPSATCPPEGRTCTESCITCMGASSGNLPQRGPVRAGLSTKWTAGRWMCGNLPSWSGEQQTTPQSPSIRTTCRPLWDGGLCGVVCCDSRLFSQEKSEDSGPGQAGSFRMTARSPHSSEVRLRPGLPSRAEALWAGATGIFLFFKKMERSDG